MVHTTRASPQSYVSTHPTGSPCTGEPTGATEMTTTLNVYIPATFALRRLARSRSPPGTRATAHAARFCHLFQRLAEPIHRPLWRNYYTEAMPLDEAENYPVVGEA